MKNILPSLQTRDLPEPVPLARMIGPGIILAGMALGSGEYILWPYIVFRSQFVFFWACLVGVTMQYFINMEISRWTLATGETAVTGFCRLSYWWAWVFLALNLIPWAVPAWSTSAAEIVRWMIWGYDSPHAIPTKYVAMIGLIGCGILLTAGPVVYETVERLQFVLVALIMALVIVLAVWLVLPRTDAIAAQIVATATLGAPKYIPDELGPELLLGALAFAGAGGTLNLAQSDYIKDKGYGMGQFIGRMTSPLTGKPEPTSQFGFQFPTTRENLVRWKRWWRNTCLEQFICFYSTTVVCLILLTSITYCLVYDANGHRVISQAEFDKADLKFIWGETNTLNDRLGPAAGVMFLLTGIAILLTTELGVLDAVSRTATNIVKTSFAPSDSTLPQSKVYFAFLWGLIGLGCIILLFSPSALRQLKFTSAMNGGVMFLYSIVIMFLNRRLPAEIRMSSWRAVVMWLAVGFFGFFTVWATIGRFS
jgi:hypothetical protein